jgi:predicted enzyme related to lactoylglutathione lyase
MGAVSTGLSRIGQIHLPVRDLGRAVAFYGETLGLRFLFEVPGMAFFDCDGTRLMLGVPESGAAPAAGAIVYYAVEDIGAAHRALSERGVAFRGSPHRVADLGDRELWLAFFDDPEGNLLALMSEPLKPV